VYCNALKHGGQVEFDFLFKQLKTSRSLSKMDYLIGLSCAREPWQLDKFLFDRLHNSNSEYMTDLENVVTHSSNHLLVWHFIKNNWIELNKFEKKNGLKFDKYSFLM
jgi:hypothetical protein